MSTQNMEQQVRSHKRPSRAGVLVAVAVAMLGAAAFVTIRPGEPASASAAVGIPHALSANALLSMSATGITGEGSAGTGSIEISSFSFGATNATPANNGGAKAGKVHFNEFTVTKKVDSASPLFFRNCVTGQHFKNVILYLQSASGSVGDSMSINLGNAIVSSINWGDASGQQPTESLSFSFATVQVTYSKQSRAG